MPAPASRSRRRFSKPIRIIQSRPRLFICVFAGLLALLVMPGSWPQATRMLLAWNIGTWGYVLLVWHMISGATPSNIRQRAQVQDEGQFPILFLSTLAAIVSLGAIVLQLGTVKEMAGLPKALAIILSGVTIASSFAFIHIMFTLHYAHDYYAEWRAEKAKPAAERGGLSFPGTTNPDYVDFLYFAFVIGVAAQTADVATTSRHMRAVALVHGIVSFFFNTTVLALTINIAAGLI